MVEYTLTVDDLVAFAKWRAHESGEDEERLPRQRVVGAWIVGVAGYLVVSAVLTIPLLVGRSLLLAGGAELVAIAAGLALGWAEWRSGRMAQWLVQRPYVRKARSALERVSGSRRVRLEPDGLRIAVDGREEQLRWSGIERIVETDDHVFIYTGPNAAHIVPRRFAGTKEFTDQLRAGLAS